MWSLRWLRISELSGRAGNRDHNQAGYAFGALLLFQSEIEVTETEKDWSLARCERIGLQIGQRAQAANNVSGLTFP